MLLFYINYINVVAMPPNFGGSKFANELSIPFYRRSGETFRNWLFPRQFSD